MTDELHPLLDQARRLAASLEGTVPEVRCLAAALDGLGDGAGPPLLDLFLPLAESQRAEKIATGLGWKPRRRELADGDLREMTVGAGVVWVCTPEVGEQVAALEARERPMRTLVLGQKPEPKPEAKAEAAPAAASEAQAQGAAPHPAPPQPVPPPPAPVQAPPESRPPTMIH